MLLQPNLMKFSLLQHICRNALRNCSKLSDVSDLRSILQSPSLRIFKAFYDSKLGNCFSFRGNKSAKTFGCASQVISPTFCKTSLTFVRFVSVRHFTCMYCINFTFCGPNLVPPFAELGIFEFTFLNFFTDVCRLFSARSAWLSTSLRGVSLHLEITFDMLIPDASVWRG